MPTITAHTGALNTPPNSLESVRAGLGCGADAIEVDVRFLPDGRPALGHDRVSGSRAVLLEDCFALMQSGSAAINLDMKETSGAAGLAALVKAYGLEEKAYMTGITASDMPAVRDCGLPYYLNCWPNPLGFGVRKLAARAKELGAVGLNIHYRACGAALMRRAREHGLLVSVWTVGSTSMMRKMLRLGVDNITTRQPDQLLEIMKNAA